MRAVRPTTSLRRPKLNRRGKTGTLISQAVLSLACTSRSLAQSWHGLLHSRTQEGAVCSQHFLQNIILVLIILIVMLHEPRSDWYQSELPRNLHPRMHSSLSMGARLAAPLLCSAQSECTAPQSML